VKEINKNKVETVTPRIPAVKNPIDKDIRTIILKDIYNCF